MIRFYKGVRPPVQPSPAERGFILAEVIVVLSLSVKALAIIAVSITSIMRHSASLSHHSAMNSQAKRTVDSFNSDVRTATEIVAPLADGFQLEIPDGAGGSDTVEYDFDDIADTLSRIEEPGMAGEVTKLLMDNIDSLSFSYITLDGNSTNKAIEVKKIQMTARLARGNGVEKVVYHDVSARALMRNKGSSN